MNELIQIANCKIGAENVNSVNTRELYDNLELAKGQYSRWIKSNLLDLFEEHFDFIGVRQTVEGNNVISYFATIDTAKHLCMIAKTEKAMEFRKYFIEVEKKSNKVLTLPEQIALLANGYQEQNERLEIAEQKLGLVERKIDNEILLTSAQKHNLRSFVNKKVFELKENHNFGEDFLKKGYMRVWKKLKNHFVVSSYMEIPKINFEEAITIVNSVEIGDLI